MLLIRPETYDLLREAAKKNIFPDPTQFETIRKDGKTYFRFREKEKFEPAKGAGLFGAFSKQYVTGTGDTFLQCGSLIGSSGGSVTIDDYKVKDATSGITATAGEILYLTANVTAVVEDGLMLPGCTLNTASLSTGAILPDNDVITVSSSSGDIHVEIGRWIVDRFLASGPPGNFLASGTVGYFVLSKS